MKAFVNSSILSIIRSSKKFNVLQNSRTCNVVYSRSIKNFGHKRQPVSFVTTLWHGFLTFTFIGFCLEWDKIKNFIFGDAFDGVQEELEAEEKAC